MIYSQTITWYTDHLPMHNGLYLCKIADSGGSVRFAFVQWENGCGWRTEDDWPFSHMVLAWASGLQGDEEVHILPPEDETPWCVGKPPCEGDYLCRIRDKDGTMWEERMSWSGGRWYADGCAAYWLNVIGWIPRHYNKE